MLVEAAASEPAAGRSFAGSASCRECHPKFYELWATSFHGLALQPWSAALAATLPAQTNEIRAGEFSFHADPARGLVEERGPRGVSRYPIQQATGGKNVYYFLTELERGWLQVLPVAYDARRGEWFDTTASALRHFADHPDAALYWKERPLTFNTSCHSCHVSQLAKNYDPASDSYRTTWAEPGINCETCHGPSAEHTRLFRALGTNPPPADALREPRLIVTRALSTAQRNDMCSPCHAKMTPLTDAFNPGDRYFDHFDLATLENRDFYPDGRDLGENYTLTQWRLSRCAQSGQLDCVHCHTSSGRYRFHAPETANQACLPCHSDRVEHAAAHTHHPAGSPGNRCIACHLPTTEFARMRRSDHSMRPPAPAATLAFASPNACNLCHTNETAHWADQRVREWRRRDYQKPLLERASLLAAARRGEWRRLPEILSWLREAGAEEIWTTSLVRALEACPQEEKWPVLRQLAGHLSPLVRGAVAEHLGRRLDRENLELLLKLAADDYRLPRVRAANALAPVREEELPPSQRAAVRAALAELENSWRARPDDIASRFNLGNFHLARGQARAALAEFQMAGRLDPTSFQPWVHSSLAHNALGENEPAEADLRRALRLAPTNAAIHLNLGLLLAEMRRPGEAEAAFRAALKADPALAQAAFNLGVLLAEKNPEECLRWCGQAARGEPGEPRYAYTLAFFQQRQGKLHEAVGTLQELIGREPAHPDAYLLLGRLYEGQGKPDQALAVYRRAARNLKLPEGLRAQFAARAGSKD